jgi:hypothetical protein
MNSAAGMDAAQTSSAGAIQVGRFGAIAMTTKIAQTAIANARTHKRRSIATVSIWPGKDRLLRPAAVW